MPKPWGTTATQIRNNNTVSNRTYIFIWKCTDANHLLLTALLSTHTVIGLHYICGHSLIHTKCNPWIKPEMISAKAPASLLTGCNRKTSWLTYGSGATWPHRRSVRAGAPLFYASGFSMQGLGLHFCALLRYGWQSSGEQSFLSPPFYSPCLPSSSSQSVQMARQRWQCSVLDSGEMQHGVFSQGTCHCGKMYSSAV